MKVTEAEFIISAVGSSQYPPDGLPEIALAGRSNVGKSSLINKMISRKNLARTSSRPGKTQTLNYYRINKDLFFVDLPGYGYAQVSRSKRETWGKFIEHYIMKREPLKLLLLLLDLRHPPSKDDVAMYDWLKHSDVPLCVVATKADKIPKGKWQKHMKIIRDALVFDPSDQIILFSAETGQGKDELWQIIETAMVAVEEEDELMEAVEVEVQVAVEAVETDEAEDN